MKTLLPLALFIITIHFTPVPIFAGEPFEPKFPERSAPILFNYTEFPVATWKSLSLTNFPWFTETTDGWYIDWDVERKPIEYLIIHHTATSGMATLEELSDIMRERLYRPVYQDPKPKNPYVLGLPMHSGHVLNGKETFTAYHFLIYPSGEIKTTLMPHKKIGDTWYVDMIGWGSGKWDVNCRSVQIALVGDYRVTTPSKEMLESLSRLIAYYRTLVPSLLIKSHREVRPQPTDCPGTWWDEWRKTVK
jgi:hypothetical protein